MSTKLQYPINQQIRDSPARPPKNKISRSPATVQQTNSFYPEINNQRPVHPEEAQANGNGSFPRKDREYRLMSEQVDTTNRVGGVRNSAESVHDGSLRYKRQDVERQYSNNEQNSLPELGKKSAQNSPSSPNLADVSQSPTYHPSPTPTLPLSNKQQLQLRGRNPPSRESIPLSDSDQDGNVEIGLENLGNTCFMNSALQCLLHIQPLVEYFMKGRMENDLNPTSPKKGMLASSFNHLIEEVVAKRSGSAIAPTNFQRAVAVFAPYLLDFQQQDSQEFLRFLLDGMSEDLCRRRQNIDSNGQQLQLTTSSNSIHSQQLHQYFHNESTHVEKPTSSGSASTTGRLSGKSAQQQNQSILPMLPGATIERLHTPPPSGSARYSSSMGIDVGDTTPSASIISPRYSSVQKLRMETRAMNEAVEHRQTDHQQSDMSLITEFSSKMRITREISAARKMVNDDSIIGTSSNTLLDSNNNSNNNNNNKSGIINFADTAPAALSSMLSIINSPENPNHDGRIESAPLSARAAYAPSFSRQLRDVMTGKTLRLRRDRTNSASSQSNTNSSLNGNGSGEEGGESGSNIKAVNVEDEAAKAWDRYLKFNDSIITDIFGGLLQSTVQCLTCQHRSYAFDPFLDLSVPIYREGGEPSTSSASKGLFSSLRQASASLSAENRSTLEKCLEKFTAEEVLDGENMVTCERCNKPRKSIKQLSIFRYPKILVVHIKRFRFNNFSREKLSTDVHFPMAGLDLCAYISHDRPRSRTQVSANQYNNNHFENLPTQREENHEELIQSAQKMQVSTTASSLPPVYSPVLKTPTSSVVNNTHTHTPGESTMVRPVSGDEPSPVYDLIGVSNHHGTLNGGHYVAHVDTDYGRSRGLSPRWVCFNDARVSLAQAAHIAGPTAYVLFYKLRDDNEV